MRCQCRGAIPHLQTQAQTLTLTPATRLRTGDLQAPRLLRGVRRRQDPPPVREDEAAPGPDVQTPLLGPLSAGVQLQRGEPAEDDQEGRQGYGALMLDCVRVASPGTSQRKFQELDGQVVALVF